MQLKKILPATAILATLISGSCLAGTLSSITTKQFNLNITQPSGVVVGTTGTVPDAGPAAEGTTLLTGIAAPMEGLSGEPVVAWGDGTTFSGPGNVMAKLTGKSDATHVITAKLDGNPVPGQDGWYKMPSNTFKVVSVGEQTLVADNYDINLKFALYND